MADVNVNSVKPSEVSNEMLALYLLASVAANESIMAVNLRDGIPVISGASKEWLLSNYVDCLKTITTRSVKMS